MTITRITDKYNDKKIWIIKRTKSGGFYVNQEILGKRFYEKDTKMTKNKFWIWV